MSAQLPESLLRYLATRDAQRAADVQSILDALTARERRLVQDAAVMGYVRGKMSGRDDPVPNDGAILGETVDACLTHRNAILFEVVGACQSFPDAYAVLTGVRPCGECDHPEYVHEDAEESDDGEETPGICLQCNHDGAGDDAHHDYRVGTEDRVTHGADAVAYRSRVPGGDLRCLEHAPAHPDRSLDWMALASDDLEDGGICSVCGRDVLIPRGELTMNRRTKWPSAQHLQQAADLTRESDPNLDPEREHYTAPLGDWLDQVANDMACWAPFREHEGGYRPWRTATRAAHGVLGLPDADTCAVCHPARHPTKEERN